MTTSMPDWPTSARCRCSPANSIGTADSLRTELAAVRQRGYAMDDEETVEGVVCFGVMIPGRRPGEGPYAASITLLKARATDERDPAPRRGPPPSG